MKALTAASIAVLSLGLASAGVAQADSLSSYPAVATPSTQTRAEVVQELRLAQSQGLVTIGDHGNYPQLQADAPALTRAQVLQELQEAKSAGLVSVGETSQYPQSL